MDSTNMQQQAGPPPMNPAREDWRRHHLLRVKQEQNEAAHATDIISGGKTLHTTLILRLSWSANQGQSTQLIPWWNSTLLFPHSLTRAPGQPSVRKCHLNAGRGWGSSWMHMTRGFDQKNKYACHSDFESGLEDKQWTEHLLKIVSQSHPPLYHRLLGSNWKDGKPSGLWKYFCSLCRLNCTQLCHFSVGSMCFHLLKRCQYYIIMLCR